MKHTGKSAHGEALARELNRTFCDTDELLREIDAAETGMRRTARDIYLEDGAERFRLLEATACQLAAGREEDLVIATGGGLCDNEAALNTTHGGLVVHLVDSPEALSQRIMRRGIPAFLRTSDAEVARTRFFALYERRVTAYDAIAKLRIDLTGMPLQTATARVISMVKEHLDGRK